MLHVRRGGSGPTCVLIHGVAGSGLLWDPVCPPFEERFDTIRIDLLGYGHSPKPRITYTPDAHVRAIYETLAGLPRPLYLVGLSMGVEIALQFAATYPDEVRAVLGIGLPYYPDERAARAGLSENLWTRLVIQRPWLARAVIGTLWGLGRHSSFMSKKLAPRIYAGEVARESMMAHYHSFSSTVWECMVRNRIEPLFERTRTIPMHFVHGSDDQWCPPARVAALLEGRANCSMEIVQGAAHNVVVLAPNDVVKASAFFDSLR